MTKKNSIRRVMAERAKTRLALRETVTKDLEAALPELKKLRDARKVCPKCGFAFSPDTYQNHILNCEADRT